MFASRSWQARSAALALAILSGLLAVALLTFDPADAPSSVAFPPQSPPANWGGSLGAYTAGLLFQGFGFGAFFLAAVPALLAGLIVRERLPEDVGTRLAGGTLAGLAMLGWAAHSAPACDPGTLLGPGGYLGQAVALAVDQQFSAPGTQILLGSWVLAGLLLAAEELISGFWRFTVGRLFGFRSRDLDNERAGIYALAGGSQLARDPFAEDLEESPAVRFGGKPVANALAVQPAAGSEPASSVSRKESTIRKDAAGNSGSEKLGAEKTNATAPPVSPAEPAAPLRLLKWQRGPEKPAAFNAGTKPLAPAKSEAPASKPPTGLKLTFPKLATAVAASGTEAVASSKRELKINTPGPKSGSGSAALSSTDQGAAAFEGYVLPPWDLLEQSEPMSYAEHEQDVRRKAKLLEQTFANFGFQVTVVEIDTGPVIAQFEIELEAGLRLSKITSLADDLAIALRVPSVRIVAPIPGKNTVGIEVPNAQRQMVRLREVMEEGAAKSAKMKLPIFLGKDASGSSLLADLTSMPHLLIAGRTGTGKSVCLNSIITSMLMTRRPDEVKMLLLDPKQVELLDYRRIPHLMNPVVTDMEKAEPILAWAVQKMEERYTLLSQAGVRHISSYNQLGAEELRKRLRPEADPHDEQALDFPTQLPYLVIVADEFADMMMTAPKEIETHIIRLAQKSRAVGIHLILATQKPTVDVITGLIKSNLPARICFQVTSRTDSRVVLDEMGADKLLGNGDMLFLSPGTSTLLRGQGTYISEQEIKSVVDFVGTTEPQYDAELVSLQPKGDEAPKDVDRQRDELYEQAIDIVVREGRGSVSLLQRAMGIGYGRAARIIDYMAEDGIVGVYNGSQARGVLISPEQWERMREEWAGASAAPAKTRGPQNAEPEDDPEADLDEDDSSTESVDDEIEDIEVDEGQYDVEDEPEEAPRPVVKLPRGRARAERFENEDELPPVTWDDEHADEPVRRPRGPASREGKKSRRRAE